MIGDIAKFKKNNIKSLNIFSSIKASPRENDLYEKCYPQFTMSSSSKLIQFIEKYRFCFLVSRLPYLNDLYFG